MEKCIVIKAYRIIAFLLGCGLLAGIARAETFHMANGESITGEIVSMDGAGIILKQADGSYGDRIPWSKLSQDDLKELDQNPKAAQYVEPFIEPSQESTVKKTDVEIKDFPRLARPAGHSLLAALFTSTMGIFIVLLIYGANFYAAYEISVFRAQPLGLVCGVSAVLPILGPIIFLAMPTKLKHKEVAGWQAAAEQLDAGVAAVVAADQAQALPTEAIAADATPTATQAPAQPAAPALPPPKIFARGQFTFNRRFFETQAPGFFAISRPEADQDKVLLVKASRGTYIAERIARISATEMFLQVNKGPASEEVAVPFVEIQEVQLKHKDA